MPNYVIEKLKLEGAYLIDYYSTVDNRGGFSKIFEKEIYKNAGIEFILNELFISKSSKNVIRGIHFQIDYPQAKLVSVPKGKVYDVIVDLRVESPTFKQWLGVELSEENHKALYVPRGFGHGFLALEDDTYMLYQCDGKYDSKTDTGIRYDDLAIGIMWPIEKEKVIQSKRDASLMSFKEYIINPIHI